jgi:MiaB-like tRNA modifying enzyme
MKSVYIETYGCSANQAHVETMEGALVANGFKSVSAPDKADAIIINTCVVKSPTENKIRDRLNFLVKKYPRKKLIITGCAADTGLFRKLVPHALFLSSHKAGEIARLLSGQPKETDKKVRRNPMVGITEISSGCLGNCSYCITKLARGDLKSKPPDEITSEVRASIAEGCREIWITSQDCGCYGLDIGTNIAKLIEKISSIGGEFRIRIGMMNPAYIKPIIKELLDAYQNPKVYKFAHIPVQSGSDKILKAMRRGYTVRDFKNIIRSFRKVIPDVTLSTDIIVGFPGESESDFEKTLGLIKRLKPDIVNISKFGPRPGTEAAKMEQVDNKIVKERSAKLAEVTRNICLGKNRRWIGKECGILVTEGGKGRRQLMGRNECYKPVIIEGKRNLLGLFFKVKIAQAGQTCLFAKIIRS